jgi:hypothetical protein
MQLGVTSFCQEVQLKTQGVVVVVVFVVVVLVVVVFFVVVFIVVVVVVVVANVVVAIMHAVWLESSVQLKVTEIRVLFDFAVSL